MDSHITYIIGNICYYLYNNRLVGMHVDIVLQVTGKLEVIKKANHAHITGVAALLELANIYNHC